MRLSALLLIGILLASRPLGAAQLDDWDFPPPGLKNYLAKLYAAEAEQRLTACSEQPVPAEEIAAGYIVTLQDEIGCLELVLFSLELLINPAFAPVRLNWNEPDLRHPTKLQEVRAAARFLSGWALPLHNPADQLYREDLAARFLIYRDLLIEAIKADYSYRVEKGL